MRIDITESINKITFPDRIWEWIDFFGDAIMVFQEEWLKHEDFIATTEWEITLLKFTNREISTFSSIYSLLRCEFIHQAAAHTRIFCEDIITLYYIAQNPDKRVKIFNEYSKIENYEIISSFLKWERDKADPSIDLQLENRRQQLESEYIKLKTQYQYVGSNGKPKPYRNWCNKSIVQQAKECGKDFEKLYSLVYKQMSAYIHGSAWSLRRQLSYSRKNYNEDVVFVDIATIVRITIIIWFELMKFYHKQLGWDTLQSLQLIADKLKDLDIKFMSSEQRYNSK